MELTQGSCRIQLIGTPYIVVNGALLRFSLKKSVALIAYLTISPGPHFREFLSTFLWLDADPGRALGYPRNCLWDINRTPLSNWLVVERQSLAIQENTGLWVDVVQLRRNLERCGKPGDVVIQKCYNCANELKDLLNNSVTDFLNGFSVKASIAFDDWQTQQNSLIKAQLSQVYDCLVKWCKQNQNHVLQLGWMYYCQGLVALEKGEWSDAQQQLKRGFQIALELKESALFISCLAAMSALAKYEDDMELSVHILGIAEKCYKDSCNLIPDYWLADALYVIDHYALHDHKRFYENAYRDGYVLILQLLFCKLEI